MHRLTRRFSRLPALRDTSTLDYRLGFAHRQDFHAYGVKVWTALFFVFLPTVQPSVATYIWGVEVLVGNDERGRNAFREKLPRPIREEFQELGDPHLAPIACAGRAREGKREFCRDRLVLLLAHVSDNAFQRIGQKF